MAQWEKLLRSLGFNESEAKLYLVSLEMGPSPVQDIAKKAKVSRVTAYAAIEKLNEFGLMSTAQRNKKHLYAAESPERLVSFVCASMCASNQINPKLSTTLAAPLQLPMAAV